MSKLQRAPWFRLAAVAGIVVALTGVASHAAGAGPQSALAGLLAAPVKVSCIYDKLSPESRDRYQKYLLLNKPSKKDEDAADALLEGPAEACTQQYGFSDKQIQYSGRYLMYRLIVESRMAALTPGTQAQIPQMFSEIPAPMIAGWATGSHSVEKKYQGFLAAFAQKYNLDEKTGQTVLDVLQFAAMARTAIAQFDHT
jgi:hypothetical protein